MSRFVRSTWVSISVISMKVSRGRAALKVWLIVPICLTLVFFGFIATWYVRQPPIYNGRVGLVDYSLVSDGGLATVQEAATLETREPAVDTGSSTNINQSKSGYLVVLEIEEQLTSAMEDLVQLYMINNLHWKLGMIEPYVSRTHLAISPPVTVSDFKTLPLLSTYFNRSHMVQNLKGCFHSDVKLNTFEDFLINGGRSFIELKFIADGTVPKGISECSFLMRHTENVLNHHLQRVKEEAMVVHGLNYQFVGVCSLCVRSKPQEPFSMLNVAKYVRQWMMNTSNQFSRSYSPKHTVVIPKWRAIRNHSSSKFFYYDPTFTALNYTDSCHLISIPFTSYVTDTAGGVLDTLALPRPLIAFHIRSEQITIQKLKYNVKGFVENCIALLAKVLQAVQRKYNVSRDHIIFIHDGTEHGSDTIDYQKRSYSARIISKVKELGIQNVQYKPLHNTRTDLAASQFVEQEILTSADVLILVGFGSFQRRLLARFRGKVKGGDQWYQMCSHTPQEDHLQGLDL